MFSKQILGRKRNEIIENNWSVSRWDWGNNSSIRKWISEFKTKEKGEGCISIQINLNDNGRDQYFAITIKLNSSDHINFFKNYIG